METHIVIGGLVAAVVVALPRVQQVDRWTNSDIHSAHTLSLLRSQTARWGAMGPNRRALLVRAHIHRNESRLSHLWGCSARVAFNRRLLVVPKVTRTVARTCRIWRRRRLV